MATLHFIWVKDTKELSRVYPQFKSTVNQKSCQAGKVGYLFAFNSQGDADGAAGWLDKAKIPYEGPSDLIPKDFKNMYVDATQQLLDGILGKDKKQK